MTILSVPGDDERRVRKALASGADEVILDLEDAVSPEAKDAARAVVCAVLAGSRAEAARVVVRVNAPRSPWCHLDLLALADLPHPPDAVMVPKVESPNEVAFVDVLLDGAQRPATPTIRLQALIESAAGVLAMPAIASSSPRVEALVIGYADLSADLGRSPENSSWEAVRERLVWAARAARIRAIDGPWLGVQVDDGFSSSVQAAHDAGLDDKWVLHPRQLARVREVFAPDEQELALARAVVEALDLAEANGRGVVDLDGQMIDEAVAVRARRLIETAELPVTDPHLRPSDDAPTKEKP